MSYNKQRAVNMILNLAIWLCLKLSGWWAGRCGYFTCPMYRGHNSQSRRLSSVPTCYLLACSMNPLFSILDTTACWHDGKNTSFLNFEDNLDHEQQFSQSLCLKLWHLPLDVKKCQLQSSEMRAECQHKYFCSPHPTSQSIDSFTSLCLHVVNR